MSLKAAWKSILKVTERATAPANARAPVYVHEIDNPKLEGTLNENSSVPVSKVGSGAIALVAGSAVLDLTAVAHPSGTAVDMTGKKVQRVAFRARSTNTSSVTIAAHGTNGYPIGFTATLAAGDPLLRGFQNNLVVVSPTAKRLLITSLDLDAIVDFVIVAG